MPTPRYTNADLARFQRKPLGITVERNREVGTPEPESLPLEPSAGQLLANAKGTLARADRLSREADQSLRDVQAGNALAETDQPSIFDSPSKRALRAVKHYINTRPEALDLATLPLSMIPNPLQGPATAYQGLRAGQRVVEGGEQRAKEHPFLTAGDALLGGGVALKALRGLKGAASAVPEVLSLPPGRLPRSLNAAPPPGPPLQLPGRPAPAGLLGPATSIQTPPPRPLAGLLGPAPEAATSVPPSLAGLQQGAASPAPAGSWAGARSQMADRLAGKRPKGRTPKQSTAPEQVSRADDNPYAVDLEAALAGPDPGIELLSGGRLNASGESAASLEAMQRLTGMKQRGEQFVVFDRGGRMRPITGPEAVDYVARPGETFGVMTPSGFSPRDSRGGRVLPQSWVPFAGK